jgi:M-phase inducer phosphatase 2
VFIVDARYPFEYAGGHIRTAENIFTDNELRRVATKLFDAPTSTRPSIVVFHCEFSSERGPRLCRLFRSLDRQYNIEKYPALSFPAVYLLDGGYAEFYRHVSCQRWCEPQGYVSMFEQEFAQDLNVHRHAKKVAHGRVHTSERQGPIRFCLS